MKKSSHKKKVILVAPKTKGGPYFIYKEREKLLKEQGNYNVILYNTSRGWMKSHWESAEVVISSIPMMRKPLCASRYYYNLRGNPKIERKTGGLGNKLLYLARRNLIFADKIILTSNFLAEKLVFSQKMKQKTNIIPNPVSIEQKKVKLKKKLNKKKVIRILTISSTKFIEKGLGIYDLGKQISSIKNIKIEWNIVAGGNKKNQDIIKERFNQIKFSNNIKVNRIGRIEKKHLEDIYTSNDIFLYGTRLETRGQTISEAMSYNLPIVLLEYELWKYIYPKEIITHNISKKIENVIDNYYKYQKISNNFTKSIQRDRVREKLYKIL